MNVYDSSDEIYICSCGARVRYSGILKVVTAVQNSKEHFCPPASDSPRPKEEIGLESMQNERRAQAEFYGGQFHSSAYFSIEREEAVKQRQKDSIQQSKRGPLTNEQKKKIGNAVHQASLNKRSK